MSQDLQKYVRSPTPANADLKTFVNTELAKIQQATDTFFKMLGDLNMLVGAQEGQSLVTIAGTTTAGAAAYTNQTLSYSKIGKLVIVTCRITWTGHTGTGNMQITPLPFQQVGGPAVPLYMIVAAGPPTTDVAFVINNIISLQTAGGAALAPITANGDIYLMGAYFAAS